jgi:hypothetical protein
MEAQEQVTLTYEEANALVEYLATRPLKETYNLFNMLVPKVQAVKEKQGKLKKVEDD